VTNLGGFYMFSRVRLICIAVVGFCAWQPAFSQVSEAPMLYPQSYQCPSSPEDHSAALNGLLELQSKLREVACGNEKLTTSLDQIAKLAGDDRKKFLAIIGSNENQRLSPADADFVRNYSTTVTETVGGFMSLLQPTGDRQGFFGFGGKDICQLSEPTRAEMVAKTSVLVSEVTSLVSKVAGPYGVPIAIGGQVLSGFLQGMSNFFTKSQVINFSKLENRLLYSESLCIFNGLDAEARQLLAPREHLRGLRAAESFAVAKLEEFQESCEECATLIQEYVPPSADQDFTDVLPQIAVSPALEKLRGLQETVKDSSLVETQENLDALIWISREVERYEALEQAPSGGIATGELQSLKIKMREFFQRAGGSFLTWFIRDEFPRNVKQLERSLRTLRVRAADGSRLPTLNDETLMDHIGTKSLWNLALLNQELDRVEMNSLLVNNVQWIYDDWRLLELRLASYDEYCKFYSEAALTSSQIFRQCQNNDYGPVFEMKNYVARTAVQLSPVIAHPDYPKHLGPHQLSLAFYKSYLNGMDDIEENGGAAESFIQSFATVYRDVAKRPYSSWQDQLDAEIANWREKRPADILEFGAPVLTDPN